MNYALRANYIEKNNINMTTESIYKPFEYTEENKKWYTDSKGRVALCFTCAYDGYCKTKMRYKRCKNYVEREIKPRTYERNI